MVAQDIESMTPDELLSIPDSNLPAGALTAIWTRRAGIIEERNAEELARELNPDYTGPRLLTRAPTTEAERLAREHEESLRLYTETMDQVRAQSSELLDRIDHQQRLDRKRLKEIEDKAIHLHDGRIAYVGQNGTYLDGQGRQLQGADAQEADDRHSQNPNASTWEQKERMQRQYDEEQQLREKVQRLHDEAKGDDGEALSDKERTAKAKNAQDQLSGFEKEFDRQSETRSATLSSQGEVSDHTYGGADYMAAYGRSTSYASTLDNAKTKPLTARFTPAAVGQEGDASLGKDLPRPAPNAMKQGPNTSQ
jgi:hypothetical protein